MVVKGDNVCGIVTMVMAVVLSNCQECWPGITEWLLHPSDYSDCLRITIMDWIMKEIVDIGILSENKCHGNSLVSRPSPSFLSLAVR